MKTPSYVFYEKSFKNIAKAVKDTLGDNIPLCYSIKANPFLLNIIPETVAKVEVCSPGELNICQALSIAPEKIIYSGVMKETVDVEKAVQYNVGIMTAESPLHVKIENDVCNKLNVRKKVILRLSSGNQFGMSEDAIKDIIARRADYTGLEIIGLHYYSGTQKKIKSIDKDLKKLEILLETLKMEYDFKPELVEYGPGLSVDYFHTDMETTDKDMLVQLGERLRDFSKKYPLGVEMGRYLASSCGVFLTQVKDLKKNAGVNYVILDGGIHHLKYYGQTMAMLIPPITSGTDFESIIKQEGKFLPVDMSSEDNQQLPEGYEEYCLCGSLCTVADVLVRNIQLPKLEIGDIIGFGKCGAYSVTEGSSLFLSRDLPAIYLAKECDVVEMLRDTNPSFVNNISDSIII